MLSSLDVRYGYATEGMRPVSRYRAERKRLRGVIRRSCIIAATLALCLFVAGGLRAQGLQGPLSGGVGGGAGGLSTPSPAPLLLNGEDNGLRRHRGPTGKPCLTVTGVPKPERINPNLFDHTITAFNDCGQRIKLQVCYYQSEHCIAMDVPPYGRDDAILGIMPGMAGFRFEFREQFNPF